MSTVVSRTFASSPQRDAADTWRVIVDLLCTASEADVKDELLLVQGIVASIISDQAPKDSAIVVNCDGPRTRIYCTYDEDAIDGTDLNESPLSFDPLKGDWAISLPCDAVDLTWVSKALKAKSKRITARDKTTTPASLEKAGNMSKLTLTIDPKGFLAP